MLIKLISVVEAINEITKRDASDAPTAPRGDEKQYRQECLSRFTRRGEFEAASVRPEQIASMRCL